MTGVFLVSLGALSVHAAPSHRVFGYSYAGGSSSTWHWDLLTDVAFFSEPMHTDGTLPTTSWLGAGKTMVTQAHAHGVRCVLTVTLFNSSTANNIHAFLSSPAAVTAGVSAIVAAVKANSGDGVNIDFEFVSSGDKAAFTAFIQSLTAQMHAAMPGSDVSIAMPSDAYPGYDIAALGAAVDTLMIMAYGYHWSSSPPGPVAPLANSTEWGAGSQRASIELFKGKVADPHKLVIGLPVYGYDYVTTSFTVPGTKVTGSTATAVTYRAAEAAAPTYGRVWDAASSTPYYLYKDAQGQFRQVFYDDAQSLALKIDQAVGADLGGIGLWELSYVAPSFWTMLDAKLGSSGGGVDAGPNTGVDAGSGAGNDAGDPGADTSGGCAVGARPASPGALAILLAALLLARRRRGRR